MLKKTFQKVPEKFSRITVSAWFPNMDINFTEQGRIALDPWA